VLFVVTMMDKEHADFDAIYRQIKAGLTPRSSRSRCRWARARSSAA
jgi:hypothetical protein